MHVHILLVRKTYSSTYQAVIQIMSYVSQIHFFYFSACFGKDPGEGGLLAGRGHLAGEEGPCEE